VLDECKTKDVGKALDREGIAVRAGHHCSQPILRRFGVKATVRSSLALYTNTEDIDALVNALQRISERPRSRALSLIGNFADGPGRKMQPTTVPFC
jgi:cysteine desulfurase / selenocysteine lyase